MNKKIKVSIRGHRHLMDESRYYDLKLNYSHDIAFGIISVETSFQQWLDRYVPHEQMINPIQIPSKNISNRR